MSKIATLMQQAAAGAVGEALAIEDVFSTYLYTGNGSTQSITNGIDLAGEGGMVWIKNRTSAYPGNIFDTVRNNGYLETSTTNAVNGAGGGTPPSSGIYPFNSDGFTFADGLLYWNASGDNYVSWTFRKTPRFFDVVTYTGNGTLVTLQHNLGVVPGCVIVKRTDAAGDWIVYHRSTGATAKALYLKLNATEALSGNTNVWNNTDPTATEFYIGPAVSLTNISGATYVAYLFAHDPLGPSGDGSDGLIACGSYTGNGSTTGPVINLGWEPQWVMIKNATTAGEQWLMVDNMRGWPTGTAVRGLYANSANAEFTGAFASMNLLPTGFQPVTTDATTNKSGDTYIYIAIRRGPMREPASGTEVFGVALGTGTYTHTTGFPVDLAIQATRASTIIHRPYDRLRGGGLYLETSSSAADQGGGTASFDNNTGYTNYAASLNAVDWMFRRAPGFFDVVAYTGTGSARTVSHNLGVAPEMMWVKKRSSATNSDWGAYHAGTGATDRLILNDVYSTQANSSFWNNTSPTASEFTVGTSVNTNENGQTFIAYLFATLPGVSKVGSYTGNGSSQTINCGFTGGARFILIKRTDSAGDWYVWDTARGIVSGNDPYLSLNTTVAEVTSYDSVDPDSSGFIVNQVAATNVNVSSASYIFYAVA
jgi:hypothetical protein